MESRPELMTAAYIDAKRELFELPLAKVAATQREVQFIKETARAFDADNDRFVREQTAHKLSTVQTLWFVAKNAPNVWRIYSLIRKAFPMKNWKTTISSVIGALVILCKVFGVEIPQPVSDGILAVALFLIGLFAKDAETPKP